jgi:hypothetical protein
MLRALPSNGQDLQSKPIAIMQDEAIHVLRDLQPFSAINLFFFCKKCPMLLSLPLLNF